MKAVCWNGKNDVRVETVPDPRLLSARDCIVRTTLTAICGSDLHLYDGFVPALEKGDILGHEFMGEVVEVGSEVRKLNKGDRIVVPFTICCGRCYYCEHGLWSQCDNSNPNAWMLEKLNGYPSAGLFGYTHLYGGYAGGQAEYVRVPFAEVGPIKVSDGFSDLPDEQLLFLSDIFPTGYMAAENCNIKPGDIVAVWGCGPVGQFAMKSATLLGAERVIGIDRFDERLRLAERFSGAVTINYEKQPDVVEELKELTGGRGPDACIDAVGMEAHGETLDALLDVTKQAVKVQMDRTTVLRQAIRACRKGGTLSIPGVYIGSNDAIPFGTAFAKSLTFRMGQTNMQKYMQPLLERIRRREIDPSAIITHRIALDDAPHGYEIFKHKEDGCIKVVMRPSRE